LPVPDAPYNKIPLESLMGNFLKTKPYFKGLSIIERIVFFAYLTPANLLKLLTV
jgi:hypothetical protein